MADSPNFQDFVGLNESTQLSALGGAVVIGSGPGAKTLIFSKDATSIGSLIWDPSTTRTISLPDANGMLAMGSQTIAVGVSTLGNTAGNTGTTVGTLVLAGAGVVTLSQSTNVGSLATITISAPAQTVQPGVTAIGVSTGGNTAGNTGTTQGTYVLAGGNNITLSQSTAAGSLATVTISGPNAVFGAGVSTGGNTAGNTGTTLGTIVFAGAGEVTLSQSTAAGSLATITISAPAQTVQPGVTAIGVSTGGNTAGNTGTTQGTYVLAGAGIVTLSQSTAAGSLATLTISASQSVQPGVTAIGVSTGGNTAGNTGTTEGTYVLAGGNQITLSQSTAAGSLATLTISGANAIFGAGISTGGNTSGTSGTVTGTLVLAGVGIVTLSQSTNATGATITISAAAAAGTGVAAIGVSTGGNTAGNTATTQGTYVLVGGNQITLSQSTAAGSLATLTISGPNAIFGAGISTGGNTSGTSGTVTGTLVLAGGNNITLSQSTNATGATITISSPTVVSGIGVSTGGNTEGNTGTTLGTIVLAGAGDVTLSQSTAAGSLATITISGGMILRSYSWPDQLATTVGSSNAGLSLMPFQVPFFLSATKAMLIAHMSGASGSTGAVTFSLGVYTLSGSTASLASSASAQLSWSSGTATTASTIYGGVSGTQYRTLSLGTWNLTPGDYLFGFYGNSTNAGSWTFFGPGQTVSLANALDTNQTNFWLPGFSTSSFVSAFPASINITNTNYVRSGASAYRQVGFLLQGTG